MSMFYELMMRKKEQIMYATIKGTLTENNGVFSGFSSSNYLIQQQSFVPQNNKWQYVVKFKVNSLSNIQYVLSRGVSAYRQICLSVLTSGAIAFGFSTTGTSWDIAGTGYGAYRLQTNTWLYAKLEWNGSAYIGYVSEDGSSWLKQVEYTSNTPMFQDNNALIMFGGNNWAGTPADTLGGSIDLPNSYIKLGSTKYKLQAVVGYTKVGSPTITDGVVSGFSESNYLQIQQSIDTSMPFEISTKFELSSLNFFSTILSSSAYQMVIRVNTSNKIDMFLTNNTTWDITQSTGTTILSANTNYWIKFKFTGTQYQILLSTDGINYTTEISVDSSVIIASMPYVDIGYRGNIGSQYFRGSIDLNETYIKRNNKLWFNGQQA